MNLETSLAKKLARRHVLGSTQVVAMNGSSLTSVLGTR
jgi:hypothetical protein